MKLYINFILLLLQWSFLFYSRQRSRSRRPQLAHQKSSLRTTQDREHDKKQGENAALIGAEKAETGSVSMMQVTVFNFSQPCH